MDRRHFVKTGSIAGIGLTALNHDLDLISEENSGKKKPGSPSLINCYYYAPHNHTMLTRHIEYDLENMVSMGVNAVSFCLQEAQMKNWHSGRVKNFVKLARKHGLKVHVVPNRWAGLLAGWLDGYSRWSISNQDTWYLSEEYRDFAYSNPKHQKVRQHYMENLKFLIEEIGIDGIIWDEPRPVNEKEVIDFLDDMSGYCKALKGDIVMSIFAESGCLHHAEWYANLKHVDYAGADGHLRSEDHNMHRMKNTVFTAHNHFYPKLNKAGKKTFFLIEAQRHRDEDLEDYLENLERAFTLPMDHLMFYYSAHEMSYQNEEIFNKKTWDMVSRISGTK